MAAVLIGRTTKTTTTTTTTNTSSQFLGNASKFIPKKTVSHSPPE
jgi:hypothetical protein